MSQRDDATGEIPLPPHVYIPGKTSRHPDDWFDSIKASVDPGIPAEKLHMTQAFIAGRVYFEAGYFWECHEVLEAVWMQAPDPGPERDFIQAMIQLANARLKLLMGRPRATLRLCEMVEARMSGYAVDRVILGIRIKVLIAGADETKAEAMRHYNSYI